MALVHSPGIILELRGCQVISHVLLGYKKRGFGKGKYTGIGGKIEAGETVQEAAVREMHEETQVALSPDNLIDAGHLTFYFPAQTSWDLTVQIFLCYTWSNDPTESAEIRPEWFDIDRLPFDKMWDDATYWYPLVLKNECVKAIFTFSDDCETVATYQIES